MQDLFTFYSNKRLFLVLAIHFTCCHSSISHYDQRFAVVLDTWHTGKQAKVALWRLFGEEVLYDLYHTAFPFDNTVLLKETLPTLNSLF